MVTSRLGEMLERAQQGDQIAENAVYRIAFCRLRSIASSLLRRETAAQTLQPTALVSELFLKLHRLESRILGEEHFYHVSARAMRQVLVDHARARRAQKKIPPELIAELLPSAARTEVDTELRLTVKAVFENLREFDPKAAETVWLRSVEGMTIEEVSRSQRRKFWDVRADYDFGLKWMADQLARRA
jgi:RNA polymerase sigma factor (TIGR02999 family)